MEKYAVPVHPIGRNPKLSQWKRSLIQLTGKYDRNYIHDVSPLLMQSYSQIRVFPHTYYHGESSCDTHVEHLFTVPMLRDLRQMHINHGAGNVPAVNVMGVVALGVSALEFDTEGIYLVSVTRSGCLTVHGYESLYSQSNQSGTEEDLTKQLLHISIFRAASAVRWNPANQDEVACTSLRTNEVHIFDIGYISSEPSEILRKRPTVSVHGSSVRKGLSDIALFNDDARVIASDTCGTISMWDRRASDLPQSVFTTNVDSGITSIQLDGDQFVIGASKSGFIYIWDLRGGRSSAAFQSHKEVSSPPLTSVRLASLLNKIGPLKAQSNILPKEIQSINVNPSCKHQLGFHLDDGWSGVLDMHNLEVSHIHCPPPPWLGESTIATSLLPTRKPSWLPQQSIYAVGSTSSNGLHLLDFNPNTNSPCHVDYDESKILEEPFQHKRNIFVPSNEHVTACAVHPFDGTIVAGTVEASLVLISQKHVCKNEDTPAEISEVQQTQEL